MLTFNVGRLGLVSAIGASIVLFFTTNVGAVIVGGCSFEVVNGAWFQVDENDQRWEIAPGSILIRFNPGADDSTRASFMAVNELSLGRPGSDLSGFQKFTYDVNRDPIALLSAVQADACVDASYLDTHLQSFGFPEDPYFLNQWNLVKARVDRAWRITGGSTELAVAVIDREGAEVGHEDLSAWVNPGEIPDNGIDDDQNGYVDDVNGWDFYADDNDPSPGSGGSQPAHGTAVAGIVGAITNNEIGVSGVAGGLGSGGVKLAAIKVSFFSDLSPAIEGTEPQSLDRSDLRFL